MSIFKFFLHPFAWEGDTAPIPEPSQPDGSVSFDRGYGTDYELDPDASGVLYPERDKMNWLFKAMTDAIGMFQKQAFPDWADPSGTGYEYALNAFVRWTDKNVYYSLADNNTAAPSDNTKWAMFSQVAASPFLTGDTILWESNVLRTGGWVWANGQTIGSLASGATGRANADTVDLFTLIWTSFPNSVRPIQDSSGSASTRGVSAAADFAANKRLPLRDMRGNVPAGADNMGGASAAGRLTNNPSGGVDGTVFGNSGGAQGVGLTSNQNGSHTHSKGSLGVSASGTPSAEIPLYDPWNGNTPTSRGTVVAVGDVLNPFPTTPARIYSASLSGSFTFAVTGTTGSSGLGESHNNVQPTTICNFITKL